MMDDLIEEKPMVNHFVELASAKLNPIQPMDEMWLPLEELKTMLQAMPEINETRVHYFKSKIKSGDYEMDSMAIAKKLLNLEPA